MRTEILFVDDEETICQLAKRMLTKENFSVTTIMSGEEALQTIEQKKPCLVFLDIKMPGRNGIDVLREIKSVAPDVPVVMVSGHLNSYLAQQATRFGACDYILKPIDWAHLRNTAHLYTFLGGAVNE